MGSFVDKYSKTELEEIVRCSFSYAEVLSKIGYSTTHGRNNELLKKRLQYYNISTEHFSYRPRHKWTDEEIFCENSKVSQHKLRCAFKEKNIKPYKCEICNLLPLWNNKPLVLTLDHKNGKNKDNRIENLRWICPNCDRQLDTYGFKNKKDLHKNMVLHPGYYDDEKQSKEINHTMNKEKICTPERQELKDKFWELKNYTSVANYYNVSTTLIRKWCRKYDLPATINIIKYTSEIGWINENWNDIPRLNVIIEQSKPCYMIDKDTNEILKEFPSHNAAGEYVAPGYKKASTHIGAVCNGHRKTAYGYKWANKNKT